MERTANDLKEMAKNVNAPVKETSKATVKKVKQAVKQVQAEVKLTGIMTRNIDDYIKHLPPAIGKAVKDLYNAIGASNFTSHQASRIELNVKGTYLLYHPNGNNKALAGKAK